MGDQWITNGEVIRFVLFFLKKVVIIIISIMHNTTTFFIITIRHFRGKLEIISHFFNVYYQMGSFQACQSRGLQS